MVIAVKNLNKKLGSSEVLKNVSIEVQKGSIFGLIGPNGAGKTTLIKCLTGIYKADSGEITVNGDKVFENTEVKKKIGYVADSNDFFDYLSVKTVVKFYKMAYESFSLERFNEINKLFKIPEDRLVRKLSKGMKTKLAIMLNLSIMPKVLVLDEPTSGLDPIAKRQVINILLEEVGERRTTIFISSHNLGELERICDKVAILFNGEITYENSVDEMKKNIKKIQAAFKDKVPENLNDWKEVMYVEKIGRVYNIITKQYNADFKDKLNKCGILFSEEIDMSLEDMFIYSVGGDARYEEILK